MPTEAVAETPATSREAVLSAPAWTLQIDAYRAVRDASCPAMFEDASPFQVARMNGAERRRYEAARDARYDKASAAHMEWRHAVRSAFILGEVTVSTPGISADARALLLADAEERDHALLDEVHERALVLCRVHPDQVAVGDVYYDPITRGPVRISKVNRKSVIVPSRYSRDGEAKMPIARLCAFPPYALSGRPSIGERRSATERACRTNDAVQAWHAQVAELRGAA